MQWTEQGSGYWLNQSCELGQYTSALQHPASLGKKNENTKHLSQSQWET